MKLQLQGRKKWDTARQGAEWYGMRAVNLAENADGPVTGGFMSDIMLLASLPFLVFS
jgi:hypothetical protein